MPDIVLYTTPMCGYCQRAKSLLHRKGVAYREIDLSREPSRWSEMMERSRRDTVPQIFIDDEHVGFALQLRLHADGGAGGV